MSENKNELETIDFEKEASQETQKEKNNIFTDFNTDKSLDIEIKNLKKSQGRDSFHYLSISLKVLEGLFVLALFVMGIFYSYVYIQKSETFSNKEYLSSVCSYFNGEINMGGTGCSSISHNKSVIEQELKKVSKEQLDKILFLLPIIYEKQSFIKTKEIAFLIDKTENKAKVLEVLARFNHFKNEFTGFEKKKINCKEFNINFKDKTLSTKCSAFSSGYTNEIIGFSGNKNNKEEYVSGTSISIANSFVNYLEKNAGKYFLVSKKQKMFTSETAIQDGYTNKTEFELNLKINF